MNTRELECFTTIAKTRSYAKSAELLFTSQSTMSYQIKHLEDELGFLLFERENRVQLTAAGQRMFEAAEVMLEAWRKSVQEARLLEAQQRKTLHIGIRRLMDEEKLSRVLEGFYHGQREYGFMLHMYRQGYFISDLLQGARDILFVDSLEVERSQEILFTPLCRGYMGYAVNKNHPLANKRAISFADLKNEHLLLPAVPPGADESPHAQMIKRFCPEGNISYSGSHENALLCASANVAIAAISYSIESKDPHVAFVPAAGFDDLQLGLAWKRNKPSPGIEPFVQLAKAVFKDGAGP